MTYHCDVTKTTERLTLLVLKITSMYVFIHNVPTGPSNKMNSTVIPHTERNVETVIGHELLGDAKLMVTGM